MIGSAIERGSLIQVFDEHGHTLFSKAKGSGAKDGARIQQFHRHRTVRLDHLHVRQRG